MELKDGTSLEGAESRYGHKIRTYDDGFGPLWVYRESLGIVGIVRAQTMESAWECVLDDILTPIDADDIADAYEFGGCDADHNCNGTMLPEGHCTEHPDAYRNLSEGYHYQPNATGSGIVAVDLNGSALDPLTPEMLREWGVRLRITADAA